MIYSNVFSRAMTPIATDVMLDEYSRQAPAEEPSKLKRRMLDIYDPRVQAAAHQALLNAPILRISREIVRIIFEELDQKDKYSLIFLCHHLHVVIFPEYVAGLQITTPNFLLGYGPADLDFRTDEDYNAINLFCLSPMVKTIDTVWFYFDSNDEDKMLQAGKFVSSLTQVEEVSLEITVRPFNGNPNGPEPPCWTWDIDATRALATIIPELAGKGCRDLSIKALSEGNMISSIPYSLKEFPDDLPPYEGIFNTLQSVTISTPMLATRFFRYWLRSSLNESPIIRLTIHSHGLPKQAWSELFSALTLPQLTQLELDIDNLPGGLFASFLQRNSTLMSLHLEQNIPGIDVFSPRNLPRNLPQSRNPDWNMNSGAAEGSGIDTFRLPYDAIPKLTTLRAPAATLAQFLVNAHGLPDLETLRVISHRVRTPPDIVSLAAVMRALCDRHRTPSELKLELFVTDIDHKAEMPSRAPFWRTIPCGNWLEEQWLWMKDMEKFRKEVYKDEATGYPCLMVKTADVRLFKGCVFSTMVHVNLEKWLEWIPCLENLVLMCEPSYTTEDQTGLVDRLWGSCPQLRTIEFYGSRLFPTNVYERPCDRMEE